MVADPKTNKQTHKHRGDYNTLHCSLAYSVIINSQLVPRPSLSTGEQICRHACLVGLQRWVTKQNPYCINTQIRLTQKQKNDKFLGSEPVRLMIKKSRLRWFGHVERKDDNDWVKRCITWEVEGLRQRGRPKKPGGIVLRMTWKV